VDPAGDLWCSYGCLRLGVFHIVLLGKPHVTQKLRVNPFQRGESLRLWSVDSIPVLLLILIVIGVILRLRHLASLTFTSKAITGIRSSTGMESTDQSLSDSPR